MSGSTGTATNASTCAPEAPRCALRGRVGHRATSRKRGVNGRKLCRFYRFLVVSSRSSADQSDKRQAQSLQDPDCPPGSASRFPLFPGGNGRFMRLPSVPGRSRRRCGRRLRASLSFRCSPGTAVRCSPRTSDRSPSAEPSGPAVRSAISVLPEPPNKSATRSPALLLFNRARSTNSTGFMVGCSRFAAGLFSCHSVD